MQFIFIRYQVDLYGATCLKIYFFTRSKIQQFENKKLLFRIDRVHSPIQ